MRLLLHSGRKVTRKPSRQATNPKRKRTKLTSLDNAHHNWDIRKTGNDIDQKIGALFRLLEECDAYLATQRARRTQKQAKKDARLLGWGGPWDILLNRITRVEALRDQVWQRLAWETFRKFKAGPSTAVNRAHAQGSIRGYMAVMPPRRRTSR